MASSLADDVLALIRTRADLHRYSAANRHGTQMHEAVDILEAAIPTSDPAIIHTVTHKALTSAITVISRADDSSGIIGDACRRLLALHPKTASAAQVSPSRLAAWMIKFQFDGDYFDIDPVAYAPALGDAGMADYRAKLDGVRAEIGPEPAEPYDPDPDRHARWVLERNQRRLAVYDNDVDAIIRTHARDRSVSAWLLDTAKALGEIGETELAMEWAQRASECAPAHQATKAADYWCGLLSEHHPDRVIHARLATFRNWPSSTTASNLYAAVGDTWPDYRDEVMSALSSNPNDAVGFALTSLKDPVLAWDLAHSLTLTSDLTWATAVEAYAKVDPAATLPIHRRLVENELAEAGAQHYRRAARRLATMRELTDNTEHASGVDEFIAQLRETHRRRPRLQQEFDRARLP